MKDDHSRRKERIVGSLNVDNMYTKLLRTSTRNGNPGRWLTSKRSGSCACGTRTEVEAMSVPPLLLN